MKDSYWIATLLFLLLFTLLIAGIAYAQTEPTVTTDPATNITSNSATLNGNLTNLGNATTVYVSFEWGLTTSYGNETTQQAMTSIGAFNANIGSLSPGATYHFRAKAVGNGTAYGGDLTFTTGTVPPTVTTNAATNITDNSATLNGDLTDLGGVATVYVSFEWGLTTSYGNETSQQAMTSTSTFYANIGSLSPGATYHFRAKAVGNGTSYGSDSMFTTGTTPPSVTTNAATNVTNDSATLNGDLTGLGSATSVNVSFEWGLTTSYGNETSQQAMNSTGTFNANIGSLSPGTTYHFRAKAIGNGTAYGSDSMFMTNILHSVTTSPANSITADSATLHGVLTGMGNLTSVDVSFEWGLTTSYGNETSVQTLTSPSAFWDTISGLSPSTVYHFRSKAVGGNSTVYGSDSTFTTAEYIYLEGWGWCTNYNKVVPITFEGYTTMVERPGAAYSYSMHAIGNLTMPAPYNETVSLDMYGSRVRSMFYLRQEVTGKSANVHGTWLESSGNETYIGISGVIGLPNPSGAVLNTARLCFIVLRTPDVEVPIAEPGSFVEDVESMFTRLIKLIDKVIDSLIGTGFSDILSNILSKIAVLLAQLRALGTPYIS